jgi:CCR4-NOT transcription complex subunit 2
LNQASHAAWNSPNANPSSQSQGANNVGLGLGTFSSPSQASSALPQQNGTHSNQTTSTAHLNAPPGVPPPSGPYTQQQPGAAASTNNSAPPLYPPNGASTEPNSIPPNANTNNPSSHQNPLSMQPTSISLPQHPQTPAQQVLVSAADRWGLLGLLAMLKNAGTDLDQGLSGIGTDLGTMGLDMAYAG